MRGRLLLLVALAIASCLPASVEAQGALEGDVYLVMKNGDVKPIAARSIFLLPESFVHRIASVCAVDEAQFSTQAQFEEMKSLSDSLLQDWHRRGRPREAAGALGPTMEYFAAKRAADSLRGLVGDSATLVRRVRAAQSIVAQQAAGAATATARSDMRGHYRISNIPGGRYIVFAEAELFERPYAWLVPVVVDARGMSTLDLDFSNRAPEHWPCIRSPAPPEKRPEVERIERGS